MIWTEKAMRTLRQMAAAGKSYSEVAARLGGISRNMVAGKAGRMGVKFHSEGRARFTPEVQAERARKGWRKLSPEAKAERLAKSIHRHRQGG